MCGGSAMSGGGINEDMLGFGFAEREMVTAQFDLQRISQRRCANEGYASAGEKAHFAESDKRRTGLREFTDDGRGADRQFGELHYGQRWRLTPSQRFNDDAHCRAMTER